MSNVEQFIESNAVNHADWTLEHFEAKVAGLYHDVVNNSDHEKINVYFVDLTPVAWYDKTNNCGYIQPLDFVPDRSISGSRTFVKLQEELDGIYKHYCDGLINKGEACVQMVAAVDAVCDGRMKMASTDEVTGMIREGDSGYDNARRYADAYIHCEKLRKNLNFHLTF